MPKQCSICHKVNCLNLRAKYCSSHSKHTATKVYTRENQISNLQPFNFLLENYNLKNSTSKNEPVILKILAILLLSLELVFILPIVIQLSFSMDGIENEEFCGYIPFWKTLPDDGDISFFYFLLFLLIAGSIWGFFIYFSKKSFLTRYLAT